MEKRCTAFYDIEKNIRKEKEELIYRCFRRQLRDRTRTNRGLNAAVTEILDVNTDLRKDIRSAIESIIKKNTSGISQSSLQEMVDEIQQILLVDEEAVVTTFLKRYLDAEFEGHLGNVNHPRRKTTVELSIKDQRISFFTTGADERLKIDQYISLEKQIIYLEDPFALDRINDFDFLFYGDIYYDHAFQIGSMIRRSKLLKGKTAAVEEVLRNQKLADIIEKIQQISDGEMVVEDGRFLYRQANLQKSLGINSLSTGVKTFLILKELLINGDLEENGIMIIDEPEVHLHPDWQIKFAEVIVMLQKAYGLNIVLTTHSMDFLAALVTYAKEYGIESSCNYYLTQLVENEDNEQFSLAELKWMNNNIQGLYASVSEPFEKLYQQMDIGDV